MILQHHCPDSAEHNSAFCLVSFLPMRWGLLADCARQLCHRYHEPCALLALSVFVPRRYALSLFADGHTVSNAPDLFRPPKLSGTGPGQYWGGGPPGKPLGCCQLFQPGEINSINLAVSWHGRVHKLTASYAVLDQPLHRPRTASLSLVFQSRRCQHRVM